MFIAKKPFTVKSADGPRVTYQKNQEVIPEDLKAGMFENLVRNDFIAEEDNPSEVYVPPVAEKKQMKVLEEIEDTMIPVKEKPVKVADIKEDGKMELVDMDEREQVVATIENGKMDLVETTEDIDLTDPEALEEIKMDDLRKIAENIGADKSRSKNGIISNIISKAKDMFSNGDD